MVLLDAKTNRPLSHGANSGSQVSQKAFQNLKMALDATEGDGRSYATNLTGSYHGNWNRAHSAPPATNFTAQYVG